MTGLTVVALEQAVAAPYATRQLADLGARVIKVERPGQGDFARSYDESVKGLSSYFVWLNRSKESLTLDVKSAAGREVLDRILATADVFVQNLGPGAAERLGLAAASLRERFPRLIVCTISGYGADGPWADRKAYDLLVQCETGLVSLTGTAETMVKAGISVADISAGMYAYSGVLSALYQRAVTGAAPTVDVSLFEALSEWMGAPMYYTLYSGSQPARVGAQHATIAPYGPYAAADGVAVLLAIQNGREWSAFCERVLLNPQLAVDERFARNSARVANRTALNAIIEERFAVLPAAAIIELLHDARIATARLCTMSDFIDHPVLSGRGRWTSVDSPSGPIQAMVPPVALGGSSPRMGPVPGIGEHTEAILREFGYGRDDIAMLRDRAVI